MAFSNYVIKFKPDNYVPPRIQEYSCTNEELDSDKTKRNLKGTLFRDRVAVIPNIEITVPPLNHTDMIALLSRLSAVKFSVEYYDSESDTYKTTDFYCPASGRKPEILRYDPLLYKSMTFRLVGYQNV